jgi:hypothetical protein
MSTTTVRGTGSNGRRAIRAVEAHPDLQLTAEIVHNPAKSGRGDCARDGRGEDAGRAAGGNAAAAGRLAGPIPWLAAAAPRLCDAPDVPLLPAAGKPRRQPA